MSTFRVLAARRAPLVSYGIVQRAGFHASIARPAGKESKLRKPTHLIAFSRREDIKKIKKENRVVANLLETDHEGRADEVESEKQDSLNKQKEGKGQWKEDLASDSESIVRLYCLCLHSQQNLRYNQEVSRVGTNLFLGESGSRRSRSIQRDNQEAAGRGYQGSRKEGLIGARTIEVIERKGNWHPMSGIIRLNRSFVRWVVVAYFLISSIES